MYTKFKRLYQKQIYTKKLNPCLSQAIPHQKMMNDIIEKLETAKNLGLNVINFEEFKKLSPGLETLFVIPEVCYLRKNNVTFE